MEEINSIEEKREKNRHFLRKNTFSKKIDLKRKMNGAILT